MPKLITTRTRIADLGKPRIIIIGGGFSGLEVAKGLNGFKAQTVLFDKFNHHCFQPLRYQVTTAFKIQSFIAWCIGMFVHLISLIGLKHKFFVLLSWLWSYFSYDKSNSLIMARPKDGVQ